ncbi:hypothetical protein [Streptomyces sp. CC228A]|nr:hypothetical protein [Streptomyces sp. CC228A]
MPFQRTMSLDELRRRNEASQNARQTQKNTTAPTPGTPKKG